MQSFIWRPNFGVDLAAVARLRANCRRPTKPMGEAWFMGDERQFFHELSGDLDLLTAEQLAPALEEIASGIQAFGPREEWCDWYHYLLGQLVVRCNESTGGKHSLIELLVSAFIAVHPDHIHRLPYPNFANDALLALGLCVMGPALWQDDEFVHDTLDSSRWWDTRADLSVSIFFCLKYLPAHLIESWLQSVASIKSPTFRAQLMTWYVGSKSLLTGATRWPADLVSNGYPSIQWLGSSQLRAPCVIAEHPGSLQGDNFLPEANVQLFLSASKALFNGDLLLDWFNSISEFPALEQALGNIPASFEQVVR